MHSQQWKNAISTGIWLFLDRNDMKGCIRELKVQISGLNFIGMKKVNG
jgi:hypothetical protein